MGFEDLPDSKYFWKNDSLKKLSDDISINYLASNEIRYPNETKYPKALRIHNYLW